MNPSAFQKSIYYFIEFWFLNNWYSHISEIRFLSKCRNILLNFSSNLIAPCEKKYKFSFTRIDIDSSTCRKTLQLFSKRKIKVQYFNRTINVQKYFSGITIDENIVFFDTSAIYYQICTIKNYLGPDEILTHQINIENNGTSKIHQFLLPWHPN